jgi:hypothetical protein
MNDDYSYVGVPATTQEAMKEDNDSDHTVVESSETFAVAGPELGLEAPVAPKLSGLTEVGLSLLSIAQNLTLWS